MYIGGRLIYNVDIIVNFYKIIELMIRFLKKKLKTVFSGGIVNPLVIV